MRKTKDELFIKQSLMSLDILIALFDIVKKETRDVFLLRDLVQLRT